MQTTEPTKATPTVQTKATREGPFFAPTGRQQTGGKAFFGGSDAGGNGFFKPRSQPVIQAKLTIGQPGDKYEQEADRMAERVVSQPAVQRQELPEEEAKINRKPLAAEITPLVQRQKEEKEPETIQRKAGTEEPEEDLQRQTAQPEEEPPVQTKTEHGSTAAPSKLQSRLDTTKGSGSPLPTGTRSQMESAFGADFGSVRVHTGSDAAGLSKDLNAQAFTHGSDVYFNEGKYRPETTEGRRLLGHELVHVVQQGAIQPSTGYFLQRETSVPTKPTSSTSSKASSTPTSKETAPAKKSSLPKKPESGKEPPSPEKPKPAKRDLHVFVYDVGDKALGPIWKASAEAFAQSADGIAVQSGASATSTLDNIVKALQKNKEKYGCIRSIEFFGHGAAGITLVGLGAIREADIPHVAAKATALTGSHSGATTALDKNFALLRDALCGSSYIHFRSCETFKDPIGEKFASRLAKYLGKTYLIGHTQIIDFNLPGREVYDPTGKKMGPAEKMPSGLLPLKQPASSLPVQQFNIEIDLAGLGKGKVEKLPGWANFFLAGRSLIRLFAQVLDHPDAEKYLLNALLIAPPHVSLGSLTEVLPKLIPTGGPTIPLIKAKGKALEVPIDRRLIERIASLQALAFPYPTPYGTVKISIIGTSKSPGLIKRAGGLELGAGAIYSPALAKSVLGMASIQLPLTSFGPKVEGIPVNLFRLHTGADVLFSNDKTAIGRLNLGLRADFETLRVDFGVFGGGGLYQGRPDWMVGGGAGLGTKLGNFTLDIGWQMFFMGQSGKEPIHAAFLKLGWRFE